jgi:hypothetical protein
LCALFDGAPTSMGTGELFRFFWSIFISFRTIRGYRPVEKSSTRDGLRHVPLRWLRPCPSTINSPRSRCSMVRALFHSR